MKSFISHKDEYENYLNESSSEPEEKVWKNWRKLVNMSLTELEEFYDSPDGKDAGMKQSDANRAGIDSGRESARWLMKMIPIGETYKKAEENWTPTMWKWCRKQISFNSRMRGMRKRMVGNPFERDGKKTRWYKSLLIWGHDPRKPLRKI